MKPFSTTVACLSLILLASIAAGAPADSQGDPVGRLLQGLEQALRSGDPGLYVDLLSVTADRPRAQAFAEQNFLSGVTRVAVRERSRMPLSGTLPGDGYSLVVQVLQEFGQQAQLGTWQLDVRRKGGGTGEPGLNPWGIANQANLTSLVGLYNLSLNPQKQFAARNLVIVAEDFELRLPAGSAFVAEADGETTALVLLGNGEMAFRPAPAAERGQVRIFAGSETLTVSFTAAFIRLNPFNFQGHVSTGELVAEQVNLSEVKRAEAVFAEEAPKSFGLELSDMSPLDWSLLPPPGDFLAEVRTRRYGTLTYAVSSTEPEDITLFDRRRRRNIALYPSQRKLAALGRFYDEDELADFQVRHFDLDVLFAPDRQWVEGRAQLRFVTQAVSLASVTLRLADSLSVRGVASDRFGPLFAVRVRGQNSIIINLPAPVPRGTEMILAVSYSGRLAPQPIDREVIDVQAAQAGVGPEAPLIAVEPSFLYSNRAYWYPQPLTSEYATATLRLTVPANYTCVASGDLQSTWPVTLESGEEGPGQTVVGSQSVFVAPQPLRYLACLISRLVPVRTQDVSVADLRAAAQPAGDGNQAALPRAGVFYNSLELSVLASPREQNHARQLADRAIDIIRFYTSLVGDYPYPSFTLGVIERELPGGHSPAYLTALGQQVVGSPLRWADDPAAFDGYPDFFLAHEVAHQWWGHAIGWKNYHEQWLSEGFAQYFAALFAGQSRGRDVFDGIVGRMARWAVKESEQGPVYLGYRVGHIQGDSRLYRAVVYNKGATVLHMLRRLIGDEAFFRGVRRFYNEWRFRKAGTDDLRQAFEAEANRPLDRFFDRWIYGSTLPQLKFTHRVESGAEGQEVVLRFEQTGEVFDLPVTVTLEYADGSAVDVIVPVTEPVAEMRVPLAGRLKRVLVNRDGAALARIA